MADGAEQLTPAENLVIERTREGEIADFFGQEPKPAIRAAFLRKLLLQLEPAWAVRLPGVRIKGARIEGVLDLSDCSGPGGAGLAALELSACEIPEAVELSHARLARLCLDDSALTKVRACEAQFDGPVSFQHVRPISDGGICSLDFDGALIDGSVEGKGAALRCDPEEPRLDRVGVFALTLRNTRIDGNVLLRPNFRAVGGVSLHGAKIAGQVDLRGAKLSVNHRYALSAGGMVLAGSLHINGGFRCEGPIFLRGARIGDGLHGDGGMIAVPEKWAQFDALNAEGAQIDGAVSLRNGFSANGVINFRAAVITGAVALHNSSFASLKPCALDLRNASIGGEVAGDAVIQNGLCLAGASVSRNLDLRGAEIADTPPQGGTHRAAFAIEATNIRIGGAALLQGAKVRGEVNLTDARIEGYLGFGGGRFANGGGFAIRAPNARVGGNLSFKAGAEPEGARTGPKTVIEGAAKFDRARVEGEVAWEGLEIRGKGPEGATPVFSFADCAIGRTLVARSLGAAQAIIDLSGASCAALNDDPAKGWGMTSTKLRLDGFSFERLEGAPADQRWSVRTRWLKERAEDFSPQPYAQLGRFYARAGLREDMRRALLAERDARTRRRPFGVTRVLASAFGLTAGYGYSPVRAARALAIFLALGVMGAIAMNDAGALVTPAGARCEGALEPALFAIDTALPVIDLGQESLCRPGRAPDAALAHGYALGDTDWRVFEGAALWRWAHGAYALFGALLSALALITFSGVMRPRGED